MSVLGWDEPYPHDVVRLSTRTHIARHRVHLCAECFKNIEIGEDYICTVYKDGRKIVEYKTHVYCPYTISLWDWAKRLWRRT